MATFPGGPGSYGLGLSDIGSDYGVAGVGVGHLGSNFGYISSAGCLTEEDPVVFAVLTNGRSGHGPGLATSLVRAALSD
jgi:hypothetical protein